MKAKTLTLLGALVVGQGAPAQPLPVPTQGPPGGVAALCFSMDMGRGSGPSMRHLRKRGASCALFS